MKEKEINNLKKSATKLRDKLRKDYTEIAKEFYQVMNKMDKFLVEIEGK